MKVAASHGVTSSETCELWGFYGGTRQATPPAYEAIQVANDAEVSRLHR